MTGVQTCALPISPGWYNNLQKTELHQFFIQSYEHQMTAAKGTDESFHTAIYVSFLSEPEINIGFFFFSLLVRWSS